MIASIKGYCLASLFRDLYQLKLYFFLKFYLCFGLPIEYALGLETCICTIRFALPIYDAVNTEKNRTLQPLHPPSMRNGRLLK